MKLFAIFPILISLTFGQLYPPYGFFSPVDVTSVTWANGVNSQKVLKETLANISVNMLEADVCRGRVKINGSFSPLEITIMAEPPSKTSDLSFQQFLDMVIDYNRNKPVDQRKGIKLDLKDYFGAAGAITIMRKRNATSNGTDLQFPVWLKAEVVRGSEDSNPTEVPTNGITIGQIVKLHKMNLPNAVLSIWWSRIGKSPFTRQNFTDMISTLRAEILDPLELEQLPINFNLRAELVENSLGNVMYLLNSTSRRSTVTLYSEKNDPAVNIVKLDDFLMVVGRHKAFVDMPFELRDNSAGTLGFNFIFIILSCSVSSILYSLHENASRTNNDN